MSRFDLLYDARHALERAVDLDDLVAALFHDHPDLLSFRVDVTNEYDDNNYSDYSRVTRVNGYSVDYDGNYEDDEEEEEEEELDTPKASQDAIHQTMNISDFVKEKYGNEKHDFERVTYEGREQKVMGCSDALCAIAVLKGEQVPINTLLDATERWVLHYADIHGRYSPEDEFTLLAREDLMGLAFEYAKNHGPLSDKTLNYFVLSLNAESHGYQYLQDYLDWMKARAA